MRVRHEGAESEGPTIHRDSLCGHDKNQCLPQEEPRAYPAEQRTLRNPHPSLCTIYTRGGRWWGMYEGRRDASGWFTLRDHGKNRSRYLLGWDTYCVA